MNRLVILFTFALFFVSYGRSAVFYSGYLDLAIPYTHEGVYLKMGTDITTPPSESTFDTAPWINPFEGGVNIGTSALLRPVVTTIGPIHEDQIVNLGVGELIDGARIFAPTYNGSATHVGSQFTLGTPGYLGFQFETSTSDPITKRGWMNLTISNNGAGVIRGWAYDDTDEGSIRVGRVEQSAPSNGAQLWTLSPGTGESFALGSAIINTGGNINSVTKTGDGATTLASANSFTGTTTINGGTLEAGVSNALGNTSSIVVNTGGTLLLSGTGTFSRINDAATITMAGGTIAFTGNVTEGSLPGTGALTLTQDSVIDFGGGNVIINFGASDDLMYAWTAGKTLSIYNWAGLNAGGGSDQLRFGLDNTALTYAQLAQIRFYDGGLGSNFLGSGTFVGSFGEVVPGMAAVPEPATAAAAAALLGLVGWVGRGRRKY